MFTKAEKAAVICTYVISITSLLISIKLLLI